MLTKENIQDIYPLTPMQEGMFFHSQMKKDIPVYFEQFTYHIKGELNMVIAQKAIREVFKRYDTLRTVFIQKSGKRLFQVVLKKVMPQIYSEDISGLRSSDAFITKYRAADRKRSFNLSKEIPVRIALFKTTENEFCLIWSFHHILMDGWCTGILVSEFGEVYESYLQGQEAPMDKKPSYGNYIKWIESRDKEKDKNYWGEYLSGFEKATVFQNRSDQVRYTKKQWHFSLDESTISTLNAHCKKYQVTFNTLFQTVWGILLEGYNNTGDVVFGNVVSGRPTTLPGVERMVGLFINTIPVRIKFEPDTRICDILKKVGRSAVNSESYQYCALNDIFNTTVVKNHLFDHILVFENYPLSEQLEGVNTATNSTYKVSGFEAFEQTNYNLNVILTCHDQLHVTFDYNSDFYEHDFLINLSNQLLRLLKQVAIDPEQQVKNLSLLSQGENQRLKLILDNTNVLFPKHVTIDDLFSDIAAKFQNRIAVIFNNDEISYGELNVRASKVAAVLVQHGVGRENVVAVYMARGIPMIVSIMGILKVGATYLPITPGLPESRISFMLDDCNAKTAITTKTTASKFEWNIPAIIYEKVLKDNLQEPELAKLHDQEDSAYIIYTSGTTGEPKGVVVTHRNVVRLLFNEAFQFSFSETDSWTLFHAFNFDFSVWEIFGALLYGGRLVIVPEKTTLDPRLFATQLLKDKITVLNQTPTAFFNVMEELLKSTRKELSLRYIIFGGEALRVARLRPWKEQFPKVLLVNMFGITETTVHVTYKEIGLAEINKGTSNIGTPIPTMSMYILDSSLRLMPPGAVGELYVGGDGLAKGYLNKPELTSQKFIKHRFKQGQKLYKTGDLARLMPNGELEYLGRKDNQIQLYGFRIELGEVQNQLMLIQGVKDALVVSKSNEIGEVSLHAYYLQESAHETINIREQLVQVLPYYMIPATFNRVNHFKLTVNGKIDHSRLPKPGDQAKKELKLPETHEQRQLLQVWQGILEREHIGIDENFFVTGGDSIKAVRLATELNTRFGSNIEIAQLYSFPTIVGMEKLIKEGNVFSDGEVEIEIEKAFKALKEEVLNGLSADDKAQIEDVYPVSDIEYGMLFHSVKDDCYTATYHDQFTYELTLPNFDLSKFEEAFRRLVQVHAIFRTGFELTLFSEAVQKVYKKVNCHIHYENLGSLEKIGQRAHIQKFIREDREQPFTLDSPPLCRPVIFQLDTHKVVFVWVFHHAILDGWSSASFLTELNNTYLGLKGGITSEKDKLRSSYRDFVKKEKIQNKNESLREFWKNELLNFNRFRPHAQLSELNSSDKLQRVLHPIAVETLDGLKRLSEQRHIPINHIYFYAFAFMITAVSFDDEVVVGLVANNRPSVPDGDKILGCFLNTLPVKLKKPRNGEWIKYLIEIHKQLTNVLNHGNLSLYEISRTVNKSAGMENPFFDVLFNYVDFHVFDQAVDLSVAISGDDQLELDSYENTNTALDFTINASGNQNSVAIVFNTDYISKNEVEVMYSYFIEALETVLNASSSVMDFNELSTVASSFLTPPILFETEYPQNETIISLFEQSVRNHPNRAALISKDLIITYQELSNRVGVLAERMREKGIGSENIVALLVDRSPELVIAILATLKTGAIYLPLSTSLPSKKLEFILEDSNAQALVVPSLATDIPFNNTWIALDSISWKEPLSHTVEFSIAPSSGAYIIYTSGTTGLPKGVLVTHENVVRLLFNDDNLFDFDENDVWSLFHSYNFDFSVWEMYGAILKGGALVIIQEEDTLTPSLFRGLLNSQKVTILNQTPSAFYSLQEEELKYDPSLKIRNVIFGGEALSPGRLKAWYERYPDSLLINMYGITETTVHVTFKKITKSEIETNISNIGRPIPTTGVTVRDSIMRRLPIYAPGELYISGKGLSRGYLNRSELTANKFIVIDGERHYRSGDLGRMFPNGELEYLGRIDKQVQIRGFRVELGEIQFQLLRHPKINDVRVISRTNSLEELSLYAYFTAADELDKVQIRSWLKMYLQTYMIPNFFIQIDKIPLTPNGKLDRDALPIPKSYAETLVVEPKTQTEVKLLKIWREMLNNEGIGLGDNYFNVGGDSIKAIRLLSTINSMMVASLGIADIYRCQTVRSLADCIDTREIETEKKEIQQITRSFHLLKERILAKNQELAGGYIKDIYPMSDIQQGMIYHSLKNPEKAIYHDQMVHQLYYESFDIKVFCKAVDMLVNKHEILRSCFNISICEEPVVLVCEGVSNAVSYENLEHLSKKGQEYFIRSEIKRDQQEQFDFTKNPLWRLTVFQLDKNRVVVFFVCHHAILDGWSDASFNTELHNTYTALKAGTRKDFKPRLSCSYKDYVIEQHALKNNESCRKYWLESLKDFKILEFPQFKIQQNQDRGTAIFRHDLGISKFQSLESMALSHGVSLKVLSFAAYLYMLNMISYHNDLVTGYVSNKRPIKEDGDKVLGCFLNTTPFRMQFDAGISWKELIQQVNEKGIAIKDYEGITLFEIVRLLGEKYTGRNPLFNTLFNYMDFHIYRSAVIKEATIDEEEIHESFFPDLEGQLSTNTSFDFSVNVTAGSYLISISYDQEVIAKNDVERLYNYFIGILDRIERNPDEKVSKAKILLAKEKFIIENLASVDNCFPHNLCIYESFREKALLFADNIALSYEDHSVSYGFLDDISDRLAVSFRNSGHREGDVVAILADRSIEMIIAIMTVLKVGGAYMPIDPLLPTERIAFMLHDSNVSMAVLNTGHTLELPTSLECIEIDILELLERSSAKLEKLTKTNSDNSAYIIYTSGTTGKPKGVAVTHKNVISLLQHDKFQFAVGSKDIWSQFHNYNFDFSVWEIFGALLSGGKTVITPVSAYRYLPTFLELIQREKISVLSQTPSSFYHLSSIADVTAVTLSSLRYIVFGGEALKSARLKEWLHKNPKTKLINMYGITETTVHVTYKAIGKEDMDTNLNNIGRPIPSLGISILDNLQQPLPPGITGEIFVLGAGVSKGYINRENLTRERFPKLAQFADQRSYRSGDMARIIEGGDLEYLGRIDEQVQLRGFRIELSEIEAVFQNIKGVERVEILAVNDINQELALRAYFIGDEINTSTLKKELGKFLPEYMIPNLIFRVTHFPITANGKLDRPNLLQMEIENKGKSKIKPANEVQIAIVGIWSSILDLEFDEIGIYDNFFDLGGHSLKAMTLIAKLRHMFGATYSLTQFIADPTVVAVSSNLIGAVGKVNYNIPSVPKKEYYQLSSAQRRLFILQQKDPKSTGYHMPRLFHLKGNWDFDKTEEACKLLIQRNEILRTSIQMVDGNPVQVVSDFIEFSIQKMNLRLKISQLNDEDVIEELMFLLIKPFDLAIAPLLKISWVEVDNGEAVLLVDKHHIISDGVSQHIFERELLGLYEGRELPMLPIQYKDFAEWEFHNNSVIKDKGVENFWKDYLEDSTFQLDLPYDYSKITMSSNIGDMQTDEFERAITLQLEHLARSSGGTISIVLLTLFNILLHKITRQNDMIVGMVIAQRNHPALNNVMGPFINTLPVRIKVGRNVTFLELLGRVKSSMLSAIENQHLFTDNLLDELTSDGKVNLGQGYNVMFTMHNLDLEAEEAHRELSSGLEIEALNFTRNEAISDLNFTAKKSDEKIQMVFQYRTGLFLDTTISRLRGYFRSIVDCILENPDVSLDKIKLSREFTTTESGFSEAEAEGFEF